MLIKNVLIILLPLHVNISNLNTSISEQEISYVDVLTIVVNN